MRITETMHHDGRHIAVRCEKQPGESLEFLALWAPQSVLHRRAYIGRGLWLTIEDRVTCYRTGADPFTSADALRWPNVSGRLPAIATGPVPC